MNNELVWFLQLNDMRMGHVEDVRLVAFGPTRESLEQFLQQETVERYITHERWHKTFRQDGPLEWYNAPMQVFDAYHFVQAPRYVDRAEGLLSVG
jgi:hypothetical protein